MLGYAVRFAEYDTIRKVCTHICPNMQKDSKSIAIMLYAYNQQDSLHSKFTEMYNKPR